MTAIPDRQERTLITKNDNLNVFKANQCRAIPIRPRYDKC